MVATSTTITFIQMNIKKPPHAGGFFYSQTLYPCYLKTNLSAIDFMTKIIFQFDESHFIAYRLKLLLLFKEGNVAMNVLIFLLIISLTVAICFLCAYIWSVKTGQFDDDYSPAHRILFDDTIENKKNEKK